MNHAETSKRKINHGKVTRELRTDASTQGWGAFSDGISTGGRWSPQEAQLHINALELLTGFWLLKAQCSSEHHCHIKLFTDSITRVSLSQEHWGLTPSFAMKLPDTWLWCKGRNIWITPALIPQVLRTPKQTLLLGSSMTRQSDFPMTSLNFPFGCLSTVHPPHYVINSCFRQHHMEFKIPARIFM